MTVASENTVLREIPVSQIKRNEDNPRLFFRQKEMEELLDSILQIGVQVPITVYRKGRHYVLIDGERRWRCCKKLNKKTIPALVRPEPSRIENVLLMFNIHALREQWDLLTIALKLRDLIELFEAEEGVAPNEAELSRRTGLNRSVIRRCNLLLALPERYHLAMKGELSKPKSRQKLTEDFFIEMERALKTVERRSPELLKDKDGVRDVLIEKFQNGIIENRVHFRKLAKIARASNVNADPQVADKALRDVFRRNQISIQDAYSASVEEQYEERSIVSRADQLIRQLEQFEDGQLDDELIEKLRELATAVRRILRGSR